MNGIDSVLEGLTERSWGETPFEQLWRAGFLCDDLIEGDGPLDQMADLDELLELLPLIYFEVEEIDAGTFLAAQTRANDRPDLAEVKERTWDPPARPAPVPTDLGYHSVYSS